MSYPFWLVKTLVRTGIARWLPSVRRRLEGGAAYLGYLSDRCLATPLDCMATLADFWQADAPDAIDLAQVAPRLDLPTPSRTAASRGYPPLGGVPELRAAIANRFNQRKLEFSPTDEILLTAGATGAFFTALDTFINPRDRVVLFSPASPLFALGLQHRRARVSWVPTTMEEGRVRFGMEPFTKALARAKLLVFADPVNPTGGVFAPEDLEQIAWWANKFDVLIYCDESFERFRYEGDSVSIASFAAARKRTLLAGSASMGHGLAAARIGWLAGYRYLVRPCAATAAMTCPFLPTTSQQLALAAMQNGDESSASVRDAFAAKRRYAFERLRSLGLEPAWPGGGLFLWIPVKGLASTGRSFAEHLFADKRVLVSPGELYGPGGEHHVRLSYAGDDGRLREGLARIAEFVAELRPTNVATTPQPAATTAEPVAVG